MRRNLSRDQLKEVERGEMEEEEGVSPSSSSSPSVVLPQIAALQLVDRGLITLDTDVGEHLPGLAHPKVLQGFNENGEPILVDAKNKVTLTRLLNHSSGLASEGEFPGELICMFDLTPRYTDYFDLALADLARYRKLKGLDYKTDEDPKVRRRLFSFPPKKS